MGEIDIFSLEEAFLACEHNDYTKALNLYGRAVKEDQHNSKVWFNLGVTEFRCRNWNAAADTFAQVIALGQYVLLATFARGLCLTKLGHPLQWPRQFDKDPAVIGLGGPAQNLANELTNRGYDAQFENKGRHCKITFQTGDIKYLILLDSPVGTDRLMSLGYRSQAEKDDWILFVDPSQCPNPTDTDQEIKALIREYPTLRLAQIPITHKGER